MRILHGLAELVFPTRCAGCEMPGALLCESCRSELPLVMAADACPLCGAPYGRFVCTECWNREWAFEATLALGEFEAPLARTVAIHKDAGERRLGALLGGLLGEAVAREWDGWAQAVAFVPATSAALRRRGFDHGLSIATELSTRLGVPRLDVLRRTAALDQRRLRREERAANAAGTFRAHATQLPERVLLCDDVFTTGATLDAAASELLSAGAGRVRCACIARVW